MNGAEESIRTLLGDDTVRAIARYCKEPHSASEIVKRVMSVRRSEDRFLNERIVGDDLKEMEKIGAISYSQEGWKTSETTLNVLKKYFGE